MQRVKILYNKKDSALIQMAEPQQAYLGKSNMPNQPAMLPTATTRKSNEKSARSLRQPKKCNQIIKKKPTRAREQQREHCSKESKAARNDQGLNPKRSRRAANSQGQGQGAAAICSLFKMKNSSNMKFQTVHTFGCHSWQLLLLLLLQLQMQQTKCINNKNC